MKKFLVALLFLAAPAFAQQKFSLYDRARMQGTAGICAKGGMTVSNDAYGNMVCVAPGTSTYVWTSNGAGSLPSWQAPGAGSGTVTTVGNGTIGSLFSVSWATATTTPAMSLDLAAQTGNCVIASPSGGGSGVPTCRSLVANDIPSLSGAIITSGTVAAARLGLATGDAGSGGTSGAVPAPGVGDATKVLSGAMTYVANGSGTVSSIATTAPIGGGTITTTGTITVADCVASGVSHARGTVPDPGASAGTSKFLREDCSFAVPPGSSVAYSGSLWMLPDPNFTVQASYERMTLGVAPPGYVQLLAEKTFLQTHANAISTPPEGWTWTNTTNLTSADTNSSLAGALHVVHNASSTDNLYTSTDTSPRLTRARDASPDGVEIVARMKETKHTGNWYACVGFIETARPTYNCKIGLVTGTQGVNMWFNNSSGTAAAGTQVNLTDQQVNTDGIWVRLVKSGQSCSGFYSTAVQTTPPTSWTQVQIAAGYVFGGEGAALSEVLVFTRDGTGSTGTITADIMYLDSTPTTTRFGVLAADAGMGADGYDSSGPVLVPIAGFDLGASTATVNDTDVQAALTEITNTRPFDAAAWTFSASRGASSPVSCGGGTYAAAASVSVGGTGRYFSLCGKATSTARIQQGSIAVERLRIPFHP